MQTSFLIQDLNKARSVGVKNEKLAHKLLCHKYTHILLFVKKNVLIFDIALKPP